MVDSERLQPRSRLRLRSPGPDSHHSPDYHTLPYSSNRADHPRVGDHVMRVSMPTENTRRQTGSGMSPDVIFGSDASQLCGVPDGRRRAMRFGSLVTYFRMTPRPLPPTTAGGLQLDTTALLTREETSITKSDLHTQYPMSCIAEFRGRPRPPGVCNSFGAGDRVLRSAVTAAWFD